MAQASSNLVPKTPVPTYGQAVKGLMGNMLSPISAIGSGVMNAVKGVGSLFSGQTSSPVASTGGASGSWTPSTSISGVVDRTKPTPQKIGGDLPLAKTSPLASAGAGTLGAGGTGSVAINMQGAGAQQGTPITDTTSTQQPTGSTPNAGLGTTVQVQDKTTGALSTMPLNQYQINQDRYNLAGETDQKNFGTPVADTSSYAGLIKQAAEAQAYARNFNQNLQNAQIGVTQTGSDLPFQTGAQQALERTYGTQAQALSTAAQNATQLAGLTSPQLASYSQQSFNPLTGQFSGGGNLQDAVSGIAQKVQNGTMSYSDAQSALSGYGQGGINALNQALGPNFNVNQSNAQATVQGQQTQQVAQYKSALQQGQNLQTQLTDLITSFGLNPNDVNAVNSGLQAIARNTSSPQYKILQNYVNDIANTYAQILTPPGGTATDTTRGIASSMLDATAAGQSIISVMKSLDQAAQAKIAGVPTFGTQSSSSTSAPAGFAW